MLIFAPGTSRDFAARVAAALDITPGRLEEREFEDGEHKLRPLESVRGQDVYVVQSLHGEPARSPGEKLCRLAFLAATLRDHGAVRVTAVIPYLAYARKDRRTQSHDPITNRYVAQIVESAGVDRVVTVDVHNPAAFENAFRRPTVHLEARPLFVRRILARLHGREAIVVSPDAGGAKRAGLLRDALAEVSGADIPMALLEKRRSGGVVSGSEHVAGPVEGRVAVIVDDLVASGTTLVRAAVACRAHGAQAVLAAATHGLFTGDADAVLNRGELETLSITDSVPPFRLRSETVCNHLEILELAPLVAEAIRRLHEERPLDDLGGFGLDQISSSEAAAATSR